MVSGRLKWAANGGGRLYNRSLITDFLQSTTTLFSKPFLFRHNNFTEIIIVVSSQNSTQVIRKTKDLFVKVGSLFFI